MYAYWNDGEEKLDDITFSRRYALPAARALRAGDFRWSETADGTFIVEIGRDFLHGQRATGTDALGKPRPRPERGTVAVVELWGDNFVEVVLTPELFDASVTERYLATERELAARRREAIEDPEGCCGGRGNNCPC